MFLPEDVNETLQSRQQSVTATLIESSEHDRLNFEESTLNPLQPAASTPGLG